MPIVPAFLSFRSGKPPQQTTNSVMVAFLLLALLAMAPIRSRAFTVQSSFSSRRTPPSTVPIPSIHTSTRAGSATVLVMAVQNINTSRMLDRETSVKRWVMRLFSFDTVCRCLVRAAKLLEDDSYQTMVHAHEHEHCSRPSSVDE